MDNIIDKMSEQFKTTAELQTYAAAQTQTIITLSKKINKLEEENKELRKAVENSIPKEGTDNKYSNLSIGEDHEVIAKIQLNKIKENAFERELTLDEVKRVDILVKVLNIKKIEESEKDKMPPMTNEELQQVLKSIN